MLVYLLLLYLASSQNVQPYDIPFYYGFFSKRYFLNQYIKNGTFDLFQYHSAIDFSYDKKKLFYVSKEKHCINVYQLIYNNITSVSNYKKTKQFGICGKKGNLIGKVQNSLFNSPSSVSYFKTASQLLMSRLNSQNIKIVNYYGCDILSSDCQNNSLITIKMKNLQLQPKINIYQNQVNQTQYLYVSDTQNNCIKRIDLQKQIVEIYAGNCIEKGFQDGPIGYQKLNSPRNLGVTRKGVVYFLDSGNNYMRKIQNNIVETLKLGSCRQYNENRVVNNYKLIQILCYKNWILKNQKNNKVKNQFNNTLLNVCTKHISQCSDSK